jgi:hypothetical protein
MASARDDDGRPLEDEQDASVAAKATDAAVRRALLESRQDLLAFLHRRLGNTDEAEEVLQRFSVRALERSSDLRDVHTGSAEFWRPQSSTITGVPAEGGIGRLPWRRLISKTLRSIRMSNSTVQFAIACTSCSRR